MDEIRQVALDWIEIINETDEGEFRKKVHFLHKFDLVDRQITDKMWYRFWREWLKNTKSSYNYYVLCLKNKMVKNVFTFPNIGDAYDYIDYRFSNIVGTNKGEIVARFYESIGAGANRKINKRLDCMQYHAWLLEGKDEYDWIIVKYLKDIPMYNFGGHSDV